ncbi:hypothetical protein U1Q18_040514 [Sarracenia purpurea var. burkii]
MRLRRTRSRSQVVFGLRIRPTDQLGLPPYSAAALLPRSFWLDGFCTKFQIVCRGSFFLKASMVYLVSTCQRAGEYGAISGFNRRYDFWYEHLTLLGLY